MLQEAEGYRQNKVSKALGETARFESVLKSYRAAPAVTKKETLSGDYGNNSDRKR